MTYPLRILLAIGCALLGFVFPLFFLLAGLIAWSVFADLTTPEQTPPVPDRSPPDFMTVQDVRDLCESPAETAFLDTMELAFDLHGAHGFVEGNGIRLRNQVELKRYRLDFLCNDNLVIEVDGAQWHSSPEAVARDSKRDADLQRDGYQVLRIPARVTLYDPDETVRRVKAALQVNEAGENVRRQSHEAAPAAAKEPIGVRNVLHKVSSAMDELAQRTELLVDQATFDAAVTKPLNPVETVVTKASELTVRQIEMAAILFDELDADLAGKTYRGLIVKIWETAGDEILKHSDVNDDLPKLRSLLKQEPLRIYALEKLERVVEEHLSTIERAHVSVFSDSTAVFGCNISRNDVSRDLKQQLTEIFFEEKDPQNFAHPYSPPSSIKIGRTQFNVWWHKNIAGDDPVRRASLSISSLIAEAGIQ